MEEEREKQGVVRRAVPWATTTAAVLGVAVGIAYWIGIVLEFEYPHVVLIGRIKSAKTMDGQAAAPELEAALGSRDLHYHTCSYCLRMLEAHPTLALFHVATPGSAQHHFFVYNRQTRQVFPATERGRRIFSSLAPAGTAVRRLDLQLGGEGVVLPVGWAHQQD